MKIIFFTNIVAPYRVELFNAIKKNSEGTDFDFEVFFMRDTEHNRTWKIDFSSIKFKYTIGNGFYKFIKGLHIHFNPILIIKLIRSRNELVLGASWNNLNILLIIILKRLGLISNTISIWSEANYLTSYSTKTNKFRDVLRNFVFMSFDGKFLVPAKMSILSFEKWGIQPKNIIYLPNLVSTKTFKNPVPEIKSNQSPPAILIVARLEENLKGILNFLTAIGIENIKKTKIKIAGSGSSFDSYKNYINKYKIHENVFLLGDLDRNTIIKEYKLADFFILPSFSDPSPLTVVEACKIGLPLLISNRCGNHFEAVVEGENGYTFDPFDKNNIREKFELLLSKREDWASFSKTSKEIADTNFDENKVLKKLISEFNRFPNTK